MRIGIDAHILGKQKGGVERYVRQLVELLPALAPMHDFVVFGAREHLPARPRANVEPVPLVFTDPIVQRSLLLPWLARRHHLDLLHVQRVAPPVPGCRVILSVHDLLPLTQPGDHTGLRNDLVRALTPASIRAAERVLVPSWAVRQELIERFGSAPDKVVAVHNGIDHGLFRATEVVADEPYVLYAGALEPRKNLELVLHAFRAFAVGRSPRPRLVIVGGERASGYGARLTDLSRRLGIGAEVAFAGFVPDERYLTLLRRARIFLAPSRGEGFDLPPLEAMACGVPVICSDIEVHRELFEGKAAFFGVHSAESLRARLDGLWDDAATRARLRRAGLEHAAGFTWERTAWNVASLYRELDKSNAA